MRTAFVKMHGLGNDFVVLDGRASELPDPSVPLVRRIANRHEGIGCDQLIVLDRSTTADARMRIFNSDGGEVGACGNASRAIALLLGQRSLVETKGGLIEVSPQHDGASVDMGIPRFEWDAVPLAYAMDTTDVPVAWDDLTNPVALNVGNPHVVFFVEDTEAVDLEFLGPIIENDPLFPERVNVNVASVTDRGHLSLRVWERGTGLTRACGTGACATAVAAMRRGLVERIVEVALPGGALTIEWQTDDRIRMTGPATESFRGSFEWDDFA